jgi:hypothetical protein
MSRTVGFEASRLWRAIVSGRSRASPLPNKLMTEESASLDLIRLRAWPLNDGDADPYAWF